VEGLKFAKRLDQLANGLCSRIFSLDIISGSRPKRKWLKPY
jgi:hypothetical protein